MGGGRSIAFLRLESAKLILSDAEVSQNLGNIGLFLWVESWGPACNVKAFPVVLINQVGAVVSNKGVLVKMHDEPGLIISHTVVVALEDKFAWLGLVLTDELVGQPNLSAIHSDHVEEIVVAELAISHFKSELIAVIAIIVGVKALHSIPDTVDEVLIDSLDNLGWVAASGVVDCIGRGEFDALVVNVEALEEVIDNG